MSFFEASTEEENLKFIKFWLGACAIFFGGVGIYYLAFTLYGKFLFNRIKQNKKVFAYQIYNGHLNNSFGVMSLTDTNKLEAYYQKEAKRGSIAVIDFVVCSFPYDKKIYISRYISKDSKFMELIDFDTRCWGYIKGVAYIPTLHLSPVADSLLWPQKSYDDYIKGKELFHKNVRDSSPYGCFCN